MTLGDILNFYKDTEYKVEKIIINNEKYFTMQSHNEDSLVGITKTIEELEYKVCKYVRECLVNPGFVAKHNINKDYRIYWKIYNGIIRDENFNNKYINIAKTIIDYYEGE